MASLWDLVVEGIGDAVLAAMTLLAVRWQLRAAGRHGAWARRRRRRWS